MPGLLRVFGRVRQGSHLALDFRLPGGLRSLIPSSSQQSVSSDSLFLGDLGQAGCVILGMCPFLLGRPGCPTVGHSSPLWSFVFLGCPR